MITNLKKAVAMAAIPALLLGSASAFAGTLITSFNFENKAGFLDYTPKVTDGATNGVRPGPITVNVDDPSLPPPDASTIPLPTQLFWGRCSNGSHDLSCLSSLDIRDRGPVDNLGDPNPKDLSRVGAPTGETFGLLETNGDWAEALNYVHNNKVLSSIGDALRAAEILAHVTLTSAEPVGTTVGPLAGFFNIRFRETSNGLTGDACPTGNPGVGCSDLFVLLDATTVLSVELGVIDGYRYFLDEMIEGLTSPLTEAQCKLVGLVGEACANAAGLITIEKESNPFRTFIRIRAEEVPVTEPSVLALMGLSLVGFAVGGRRRKSK